MRHLKFSKSSLIRALVLGAVIVTGTVSAADPGATAAGTALYSTNTVITFTNSAGGSFQAAGEASTQTVLSIYGFENFSPLQISYTNDMIAAGAVLYFTNVFTNYANTNSVFNFSSASVFSGTFGSPWTVELLDASLTPAASASVAKDSEYKLITRVTIDAAAQNNALGQISITNAILTPEEISRQASYSSTNGFAYGGVQMWNDLITIRVGGPVIAAVKTVSITNQAGGAGIGANDLVPGAVITYSITYTNTGNAAAYNVSFTEALSTVLAGFQTGSVSGADVYDYSIAGTWGQTPAAGYDQTIDGIRFTVNSIAAGTGGTVTYKIVLR